MEAVYRSDWGKIVATLVRRVGDCDLAEESAREAFTAAVDQWRRDGVPESTRAWLIQTARLKPSTGFAAGSASKPMAMTGCKPWRALVEIPDDDGSQIPDDQLRLILTCCHPVAPEARIARWAALALATNDSERRFLQPLPELAMLP